MPTMSGWVRSSTCIERERVDGMDASGFPAGSLSRGAHHILLRLYRFETVTLHDLRSFFSEQFTGDSTLGGRRRCGPYEYSKIHSSDS